MVKFDGISFIWIQMYQDHSHCAIECKACRIPLSWIHTTYGHRIRHTTIVKCQLIAPCFDITDCWSILLRTLLLHRCVEKKHISSFAVLKCFMSKKLLYWVLLFTTVVTICTSFTLNHVNYRSHDSENCN